MVVETVPVAAETAELLALAADRRGAGVGWVDLTAPEVGDQLADLRARPGGDRLAGLRHDVQREPDPRWLVRPDVLPRTRRGRPLRPGVRAARRPGAAAGRGRGGARPADRPFRADPRRQAALASGVLEAGRRRCARSPRRRTSRASCPAWSPRPTTSGRCRAAPVAAHVLDVFGPERVMAGSDWPVCLLRADYDDVWAADGAARPVGGRAPGGPSRHRDGLVRPSGAETRTLGRTPRGHRPRLRRREHRQPLPRGDRRDRPRDGGRSLGRRGSATSTPHRTTGSACPSAGSARRWPGAPATSTCCRPRSAGCSCPNPPARRRTSTSGFDVPATTCAGSGTTRATASAAHRGEPGAARARPRRHRPASTTRTTTSDRRSPRRCPALVEPARARASSARSASGMNQWQAPAAVRPRHRRRRRHAGRPLDAAGPHGRADCSPSASAGRRRCSPQRPSTPACFATRPGGRHATSTTTPRTRRSSAAARELGRRWPSPRHRPAARRPQLPAAPPRGATVVRPAVPARRRQVRQRSGMSTPVPEACLDARPRPSSKECREQHQARSPSVTSASRPRWSSTAPTP